MIFSEKLLNLRKKNGWSQEQLAEKLNVTRQSISKWESAQSIPDLDKILSLSKIFGVSTDYLIKDELEEAEIVPEVDMDSKFHKISLADAQEFLLIKATTAKQIALATFLCIISPICLILLGAASERTTSGISENVAGGVGLCIMLLLVAIACTIFISCGMKTKKFEFLEKEEFETEYGVTGMVKERKQKYESTYTKYNILGTVFCILSLLPLFFGIMISENELFIVTMLCFLFLFVGIGVRFFIIAGINYTTMEKLLQEGDYTKIKKHRNKSNQPISTIYWSITTALYVGYSLFTNNWERSWILWPVAGILYAAVLSIWSSFQKND